MRDFAVVSSLNTEIKASRVRFIKKLSRGQHRVLLAYTEPAEYRTQNIIRGNFACDLRENTYKFIKLKCNDFREFTPFEERLQCVHAFDRCIKFLQDANSGKKRIFMINKFSCHNLPE